MALVRRTVAVGRAQVPSGSAAIPQQPGSAGAPAAPGGPGAVPAAAPIAMAGQEAAAAVPSSPAKAWAVVSGLGLTGVGGWSAFNIQQLAAPSVFQIGDQMSTFGVLLVFSAAVERVLEPFSRFMPGRGPQHRYEKAVADMDNGVPGATNAAAHYKAQVDSARSSRGILMWGLATFAATVFAASSGFCLLHTLAASPTWDGVSYWIDALITGLVVGSGTKPVHDLLTRFQNQATQSAG